MIAHGMISQSKGAEGRRNPTVREGAEGRNPSVSEGAKKPSPSLTVGSLPEAHDEYQSTAKK